MTWWSILPARRRREFDSELKLAAVRLRDRALSTSGIGEQHFEADGKRYGHLLNPRTGRPVEGMLQACVVAPDAALAEALSTAFFVMGLEKARSYCDNHPQVGALLIPAPRRGRTLEPICCGIPDEELFFFAP